MERPERRSKDRDENGPESSSSTYVLIALGLAFAFLGVSVGATKGDPVAAALLMFPTAVLLAIGVSRLQQKRRKVVSPKHGKERELLSFARDNGGSITPVEAALETSLTVREADELLSELANGGHLLVESENGALFYSLPGRRRPELGGPEPG